MKTAIWALVLLFPSLCWAASDARSSDAEEMGELVTAEWLHAHLADDDLVVLDSSVLVLLDENQQMSNVSGYQDFLEAHVPGARFADLLVALSGPEARLAMPSAEAFAKALGELGIHNQDKIVVYSSAMHVWSARLWWMLKWIGHDRVAILDGGLTAWRDAGYPVASDEVSTTRTQYQPRVRAERLRSCSLSSFLRRRMLSGVTSTSSSSSMNSSACSSVCFTGGVRINASSVPAARMLVSCLALVGFTGGRCRGCAGRRSGPRRPRCSGHEQASAILQVEQARRRGSCR
jgi:rhodanese-related sulfurtransferase